MNEITITNRDGKLTVSSLQVASDFGKQHKHVLDVIEELKEGVAEKSADLFIEKTYHHTQNKQWYKCYDITRDNFSLLVIPYNRTRRNC